MLMSSLGAYVDLEDDSYSLAIEKAMGRNQIAYACANKEDSSTLRKLIMRKLGREGQMIDVLNVKREARFKAKDCLSADLKREGVPTVEQMISGMCSQPQAWLLHRVNCSVPSL